MKMNLALQSFVLFQFSLVEINTCQDSLDVEIEFYVIVCFHIAILVKGFYILPNGIAFMFHTLIL